MESIVDPFATKGFEYLIAVAFLLLLVGFWKLLSRPAGLALRPVGRLVSLIAGGCADGEGRDVVMRSVTRGVGEGAHDDVRANRGRARRDSHRIRSRILHILYPLLALESVEGKQLRSHHCYANRSAGEFRQAQGGRPL